MEPQENLGAKSLLTDRFGDEGDEQPSQFSTSTVAEVPLKLTDQRFAAEETRLQDFNLKTLSDNPGKRAIGGAVPALTEPRLREAAPEAAGSPEKPGLEDVEAERPAEFHRFIQHQALDNYATRGWA